MGMTSQVVFTLDTKVKQRAMARAKAVGVPFASVLKLAAKAFADGNYSVGFERDETFNPKTAARVRAAYHDVEAGKNLVSFKTAKDMDDYLLSV